MTDYIRKAAELADGWSIVGSVISPPSTVSIGMSVHNPSTWILDALAAQLVRQVDALDPTIAIVRSGRTRTNIERRLLTKDKGLYKDEDFEITFYSESPDRTMNTIKAIIDSGVLSEQ